MTKGQARGLLIAAAVAVVLLAGFGVYVWRSGDDMLDARPPATDATSVAAAFHDAYQRGDTPTMCALSTGDALTRLQAPGWCDTSPGWSTVAVASQQCTTPNGERVYAYKLNPLVLGKRGMEFKVADTGQGVWRVTFWGHTADRTLCDIYR